MGPNASVALSEVLVQGRCMLCQTLVHAWSPPPQLLEDSQSEKRERKRNHIINRIQIEY